MFETIAIVDFYAIYIRGAITVWGFLAVFYKLFKKPGILKIEYKNLALIFICLCLFTSFLHISWNFFTNIALVFHIFLCFFIFFGAGRNTAKIKFEKEFIFLIHFFILFSSVISLLSFIVFLHKFSINISGYTIGIIGDRLTGLYSNSNFMAFFAVIALVSIDVSDNFYFKNRIKIHFYLKIFLMLINITSLFLSDSNASFVFIIIYFILKIFLNKFFIETKNSSLNLFREGFFLFLCSLILVSGAFLLRSGAQGIISFAANNIKRKTTEIILINNINESEMNMVTTFQEEEIKFGRSNYEISSGRIFLFKQGFELFKYHKFFGIGRANLFEYSRIYLDTELIFPDLHNGYLTILVSYGIFGFACFFIFIVMVFKKYINIARNSHEADSELMVKLLSVLISYIIYAFFEKTFFSEASFMGTVFWVFLGFLRVTANKIMKNFRT
jgi:O-antigen ligase